MAATDSTTYVQTKHRDYYRYNEKWKLIRSVISGEVNEYLRNVGKTECDNVVGSQRQKEYEDGAIYYNFTKRTVDGMVGSIFRKDPEIELTTQTMYLLEDVDGNGQGISQQAQAVVRDDIEIGRGGLFVDTPSMEATDGNETSGRVVTLQDQRDGKINPKIQFYPAESIINWRTERFGSVNKLRMIVLREEYEYQSGDNKYLWLTGYQYRTLELDDEGYYKQTVTKFNQVGEAVGGDAVYEPISNGSRMTEIPFVFVGAENNDYAIDEPPMYPLSTLNIGHYRNSADNEEFLHILGQAMLTISPSDAMSAKWKEYNPDGVKFGARAGLVLGANGSASILQAQPNNANSQAMKDKEAQAVQIGAQLITPSSQETAEAARIKQGADTSVLASIAVNVSDAYGKAIQWCMDFLNDSGEFKFELSTDFFFEKVTAEERAQWVSEIQMGITPKDYFYSTMRKTGQFDPEASNEDIDALLEEDNMNGNQGLMGGMVQQEAPVQDGE
ncbi:putative portal protein [Vibrio phage 242E40-1]|nr:putative portal protein [Vibrio phage 242E40-1]